MICLEPLTNLFSRYYKPNQAAITCYYKPNQAAIINYLRLIFEEESVFILLKSNLKKQ